MKNAHLLANALELCTNVMQLFLSTVLESGAPLSNIFEEALYESLNE